MDLGGDLLAQIPAGHRADDPLHLARGADEIVDQAVHGLDGPGPPPVRTPEHDPPGQLALLADNAADLFQLDFQRLIGGDPVVQRIRDLSRYAGPVQRHPRGEIAVPDLEQHGEQHRLVKAVRADKSRRGRSGGRDRAIPGRRVSASARSPTRHGAGHQLLHQVAASSTSQKGGSPSASDRSRGEGPRG